MKIQLTQRRVQFGSALLALWIACGLTLSLIAFSRPSAGACSEVVSSHHQLCQAVTPQDLEKQAAKRLVVEMETARAQQRARANSQSISSVKAASSSPPLKVVRTLPMSAKDAIPDLGFGNGSLWGLDGVFADVYYIDQINQTNGSILKYLKAPGTSDGNISIEFANNFLWSLNFLDDVIYKINPQTGSVLGSINAPASSVSSGLGFDGTHLWYGDWDEIITKISTAGIVVDRFSLPIGYIKDITFINGELWLTGEDTIDSNYYIYRINKETHAIIDQFERSPCEWGLTFDGTHLWTADWCDMSYTLYEIPTSRFPLTVKKLGSGDGKVTSNPDGINCGATCAAHFASNSSIKLTAVAGSGSVFSGWSGACSGSTLTCAVTMNAAKTVNATFTTAPTTFSLSVSKMGNGTVTSAPAGINCGSGPDCTANFNSGTTVTLTARPASGSVFIGWSGACSGKGSCAVTVDTTKNVTATFKAIYPLVVTKKGSGLGTVTSSPAGINCGNNCKKFYINGTRVTLTPAPASGSVFSGWSGACSGQEACVVTLDQAKNVMATFGVISSDTYRLTIVKQGVGKEGGAVISNPGGINCGSDCSEIYANNTIVNLTATTFSGLNTFFQGWGGACSGRAETCSVKLDKNKRVTARFEIMYSLTVKPIGSGSGTITSVPSGINCGKLCVKFYVVDTKVTLTATPDSGSSFIAWRGCKALDGNPKKCEVTIKPSIEDGDGREVSAIFSPSKAKPAHDLID